MDAQIVWWLKETKCKTMDCLSSLYIGFPWWPRGKQFACSAGDTDMQVQSLGWEDALEEETATHSSNLGQKITMDSRAWRATVHGVTKESDTTEWLNHKNSKYRLRTGKTKPWRQKSEQWLRRLPWWSSGHESTLRCRRQGFNLCSGK